MKPYIPLSFCCLLITTFAVGEVHGQDVDREAEAQRIRELVKQWVAAVGKKDADAVANYYAEDGRLMPPNAPLIEGRDAVGRAWQAMMQLPGFSLTFESKDVSVAEAGDMAYEVGTYTLSLDNPDGARVQDRGKYVVVWQKSGGEWKVAADIFNSDLPPPGQQQ